MTRFPYRSVVVFATGGARIANGLFESVCVEEWQLGMARERAQERAEDLGDHLEEPPEHPTHG